MRPRPSPPEHERRKAHISKTPAMLAGQPGTPPRPSGAKQNSPKLNLQLARLRRSDRGAKTYTVFPMLFAVSANRFTTGATHLFPQEL
jgi:hypothetical protein